MADLSALKKYGIDTEEGLAYCADDPEFYEEMLAEYVNEGAGNVPELKGMFEAKDWEHYRIIAHSVKSTSRMIGAKEMAERAFEMETAAKEGSTEAIIASHPQFLEKYDNLIAILQKELGL